MRRSAREGVLRTQENAIEMLDGACRLNIFKKRKDGCELVKILLH
jgi:hypothetical protein